MNVKLIAAAIATLGLAACSPDITPQSSTAPGAPAVSSAPAQPAAEVAQAGKPAAPPAAGEEKKEEGAAPGSEVKKDEGEKKAD